MNIHCAGENLHPGVRRGHSVWQPQWLPSVLADHCVRQAQCVPQVEGLAYKRRAGRLHAAKRRHGQGGAPIQSLCLGWQADTRSRAQAGWAVRKPNWNSYYYGSPLCCIEAVSYLWMNLIKRPATWRCKYENSELRDDLSISIHKHRPTYLLLTSAHPTSSVFGKGCSTNFIDHCFNFIPLF